MIEEYLEDVDRVEEVEGEINVIEGLTSYKVNQINEMIEIYYYLKYIEF